jgi:hypothetical protein
LGQSGGNHCADQARRSECVSVVEIGHAPEPLFAPGCGGKQNLKYSPKHKFSSSWKRNVDGGDGRAPVPLLLARKVDESASYPT